MSVMIIYGELNFLNKIVAKIILRGSSFIQIKMILGTLETEINYSSEKLEDEIEQLNGRLSFIEKEWNDFVKKLMQMRLIFPDQEFWNDCQTIEGTLKNFIMTLNNLQLVFNIIIDNIFQANKIRILYAVRLFDKH